MREGCPGYKRRIDQLRVFFAPAAGPLLIVVGLLMTLLPLLLLCLPLFNMLRLLRVFLL